MAPKAAPPTGSPDVAQILAKMRTGPARGRGRRSSLYRWFRENHARLLKEFELSAPSWPALADALAESGLTNGDNQRPTAEGARTTWYRVRREIAGGRRGRPVPHPSEAAAGVTRAGAAATSPTAPVLDGDNGEAEVQRRFKFVKPRGWDADAKAPPAPPEPKAPAPVPDEPRVDVDDVLAKFLPSATRRE